MIGKFCKEYRTSQGFSVSELTSEVPVQTLYTFERGGSTNVNILKFYYALAITIDDVENFERGLLDSMKEQFYG